MEYIYVYVCVCVLGVGEVSGCMAHWDKTSKRVCLLSLVSYYTLATGRRTSYLSVTVPPYILEHTCYTTTKEAGKTIV